MVGEGIGGQLLESAEADLVNYDRIALFVFAENEVGIGFYEEKGFERIGEDVVEIGDEEYREYRYEKSLQSL
jgi:ribosomal protein S18 acetylase RimI-like enzyme